MLSTVTDASPDFARTADDYARHRAGFPQELLDRLAARGFARAGTRVVDLGTGTGSLARLFARHGCEVTGVDIAGSLLEQARRLDREAGVEEPAEATSLPASAPVAGMLDDDGVRACSQELTTMLAERYPENPLTIPHRVWAVRAQAPPS